MPVQIVAPGTLPRFEMKARRFVVERVRLVQVGHGVRSGLRSTLELIRE